MNTQRDIRLGRDVQNLDPGEVFASATGEAIGTLLGTCVAVTICDPVARVGGVNHFLLPVAGSGASIGEGDQGRYAEPAIQSLLTRVLALGSTRSRCEAKVFGGASPDSFAAGGRIGAENVAMAFAVLKRLGIPVVAHDVGGSVSRRVILKSESGRVLVKRTSWNRIEEKSDETEDR